jgi:hypothetical protein
MQARACQKRAKVAQMANNPKSCSLLHFQKVKTKLMWQFQAVSSGYDLGAILSMPVVLVAVMRFQEYSKTTPWVPVTYEHLG